MFFFLLLMNRFLGRGREKGDMLAGATFFFSYSSHLFCSSVFRMHRLCSRETAGFCHSLAFFWVFMHIIKEYHFLMHSVFIVWVANPTIT